MDAYSTFHKVYTFEDLLLHLQLIDSTFSSWHVSMLLVFVTFQTGERLNRAAICTGH